MAKNFFHYFPVAPVDCAWGLYATSFGHTRVCSGGVYPSTGHPAGHHFAWDQGRTLDEYQLLYIHAGRGLFESSSTKQKTMERGTVFLLFPGIWHRYRPDFSTGWTESWIELTGPYMDHLRAEKIIDPREPVYQIEAVNEVEELLEAAYRLARTKPLGFPVRLGLLAVQILALLRSSSSRPQPTPQRIDRIISEAQALYARDSERRVSAEQIARRLGIGYSYFRKEFKHRTGFSPKQYQIEIRHRHARDLLRNTNLTVKEVAGRLGFHSPYHFSADFSRRNGLSPLQWRRVILPRDPARPVGTGRR